MDGSMHRPLQMPCCGPSWPCWPSGDRSHVPTQRAIVVSGACASHDSAGVGSLGDLWHVGDRLLHFPLSPFGSLSGGN